jgi:hypothetical protein
MYTMLKTKLLIFLMIAGCSISLSAEDARLFITRAAVYNGQKSLVITGYSGAARTVVIPARINGIPVKIIGDNAFRLKLLIKVIIPEGIEIIGAQAFTGNRLMVVVIPPSVKVIAPSAFDSQTRRLVSDGRTTVISDESYNPLASYGRNDSPVTVVFLSQIGNSPQEAVKNPNQPCPVPAVNVSAASAVGADIGGTPIILNSESGIGTLAYNNAGLYAIAIPQDAKFIGNGAFLSNNLVAVAIPPSVRRISSQAFMGNPLVSITIGENVLVQYDSFRYQFSDYYRMNNYKAGTYILKAGHWNFEGQEHGPKTIR